MSRDLNAINSALDSPESTYTPPPPTPKFFSDTLTGNSARPTGLLNENVNPATASMANVFFRDDLHTEKTDKMRVKYRPFSLLSRSVYEEAVSIPGMRVPLPDLSTAFEITPEGSQTRLFYNVEPHTATIIEPAKLDKYTPKEPNSVHILYRTELCALPADYDSGLPPQGFPANLKDTIDSVSQDPVMAVHFTQAPCAPSEITKLISKQSVVDVDDPDHDEIMGFFSTQYNLHDKISALASLWMGLHKLVTMADIYNSLIRAASNIDKNKAVPLLTEALIHIDNYSVPLDGITAIHTQLATSFPKDVHTLSKVNLGLLMADTLASLDHELPSHTAVPAPTASSMQSLPDFYSPQQRDALTASGSASLVIAAAGTGKTTTIIGRIDYLTTPHGDDPAVFTPEEIVSLSFTNAAADNIKERKPGIEAKTIASMINEIYTLNYPRHQLSSLSTMSYSIQSYFPFNETAERFTHLLRGVEMNLPSSMAKLNLFVEQNFDEVISMLDTISQTTLELQQIIAYQQIWKLAEPNDVAPKYLIIDEVQDNSIFEFIFALEYIRKHKAGLYIVGDPSQTLYEFRSANPRALTALEHSGLFSIFPLTTNYRSNAEILTFANAHLAAIEANRTSNLRLQASGARLPSAADFDHRVRVDYTWAQSRSKFNLVNHMKSPAVRNYIDSRLARGEKVAFLAWYRNDTADMTLALEEMYPGAEIAYLTSERPFELSIFSKFTAQYWNDVMQVTPPQAPYYISQSLKTNLDKLAFVTDSNRSNFENHINDWWVSYSGPIRAWQQAVQNGTMPKQTYFDSLKRSLLRHEIEMNNYASRITNTKNRQRKEENALSDAPFIISTIHGAKGLEFDNVVLFHQYRNHMSEEMKRMYYVALTRAINTEYIISTGSVKNAEIEKHHESIMTSLLNREKVMALKASGFNPGQLDDEAFNQALHQINFTPAQAHELAATKPPIIITSEPDQQPAKQADGVPADDDPTEPPEAPSAVSALASLGIAVRTPGA